MQKSRRQPALWHMAHSEHILQRKLHDSRILGSDDFPEQRAVESRYWIHHAEVVEQIERLEPQFHLLCFTHLKNSGDRCVDIPTARAGNAACTDISERPERRQLKGGGIEIVAGGPGPVRVSQYLIATLAGQTAIQRRVLAGGYIQLVTRKGFK